MSEDINLYFGQTGPEFKDKTHIQIWKGSPDSDEVNLMIDGRWLVVLSDEGLEELDKATRIANEKNKP